LNINYFGIIIVLPEAENTCNTVFTM